jgi:transcriptional antiterminator Rof (Rho-off)
MSKYENVGCEFYDQLLEIVKAGQKVQIDYQDEDRKFYKIEALAIDVITKDKEEFLILEGFEPIRLDYLHKVGKAISDSVLNRGNSCSA